MVCGNNHIVVQIKFLSLCTRTESVQTEQAALPLSYLKGLPLYLACGTFSFAGLLFSLFLRVFVRNISHYHFKLWDIRTPNQGHRSPEPALTGKEASVTSCPNPFPLPWPDSSHLFLHLLWKGETMLCFWMETEWSKYVFPYMHDYFKEVGFLCQVRPVLLPLGVYKSIPQPPETLPIPLLSLISIKRSLLWQPNIYTISFCRFCCCLSAWSVPRTPHLGTAALPSASLILSTVSWALKLDNWN